MAQLSGIQIISLVGRQGSGKTTLGDILADRLGGVRVEASSVVRQIHGDLPRSEMPKTNARTETEPDWLGNAIIEEFFKRVPWKSILGDKPNLVLTGAREIEVHDTLVANGAKLVTYVAYADPVIRFKRLLQLGKCKTWAEFCEQDIAEGYIGLDTLLAQNNPVFHTSHFTNPEEIVDLMQSFLDNGVVE